MLVGKFSLDQIIGRMDYRRPDQVIGGLIS